MSGSASEPSFSSSPIVDYVEKLTKSVNEKAEALGLSKNQELKLLQEVQSSFNQNELFVLKVAESANTYRTMLESIRENIQNNLQSAQFSSPSYKTCIKAFEDINKVVKQMQASPKNMESFYEAYKNAVTEFIDAYLKLVHACVKASGNKKKAKSWWPEGIKIPNLNWQLNCGGAKMPNEVFEWYNKTDDGLADKTVFCQMPSLTQAVAEKAGNWAGEYYGGSSFFGKKMGGFAGGLTFGKLFAQNEKIANPVIPARQVSGGGPLAKDYSVKISRGDFVGVAKDAPKIQCNGKEAPKQITDWVTTPTSPETDKVVFCKTHGTDGGDADAIIASTQRVGWMKIIWDGDFVGLQRTKQKDGEGDDGAGEREPVREANQEGAGENPEGGGEAAGAAGEEGAGENAEGAGAEAAPAGEPYREGAVENAEEAGEAAGAAARAEVNNLLGENAGNMFELLQTISRDIANQVKEKELDLALTEAMYDKVRNTIIATAGNSALLELGPTLVSIMNNATAYLGWSWTVAQTVATNSTEPAKSAFETQNDGMKTIILETVSPNFNVQQGRPIREQFTEAFDSMMEAVARHAAEGKQSPLQYVLNIIKTRGSTPEELTKATQAGAKTAGKIIMGNLKEAEEMLKYVQPVLKTFNLKPTENWPITEYKNMEEEFQKLGEALKTKLRRKLNVSTFEFLEEKTKKVVQNASSTNSTVTVKPEQDETVTSGGQGGGGSGGRSKNVTFNATGEGQFEEDADLIFGDLGGGGPGDEQNFAKVESSAYDLPSKPSDGTDSDSAIGFPIKINRPIFFRYLEKALPELRSAIAEMSPLDFINSGLRLRQVWLLAQGLCLGTGLGSTAILTPMIEAITQKNFEALFSAAQDPKFIQAASIAALRQIVPEVAFAQFNDYPNLQIEGGGV